MFGELMATVFQMGTQSCDAEICLDMKSLQIPGLYGQGGSELSKRDEV